MTVSVTACRRRPFLQGFRPVRTVRRLTGERRRICKGHGLIRHSARDLSERGVSRASLTGQDAFRTSPCPLVQILCERGRKPPYCPHRVKALEKRTNQHRRTGTHRRAMVAIPFGAWYIFDRRGKEKTDYVDDIDTMVLLCAGVISDGLCSADAALPSFRRAGKGGTGIRCAPAFPI